MYPESWLDTTAESLIYKYRVMTVVSSTSVTSRWAQLFLILSK